MMEGSLKLSLFFLGLLLSAATSLSDLYLKDVNPYIYWPVLGLIAWGLCTFIIAPIYDMLAFKRLEGLLLLPLCIMTGMALSLSVFFIPNSSPHSTTSESQQEELLSLNSKAFFENSSILIMDENDCQRELSINDTKFTNCSLSCPLDLRICETFNYMILCLSDGSDLQFSKELKLISLPRGDELCGSEYKLRYADRVDMELAPGCKLECDTIAFWRTQSLPSPRLTEASDFKFYFASGLVLLVCLMFVTHGRHLVRGSVKDLGDKYAYFLFGSVVVTTATPYIEDIPGNIDVSIYLLASLIASSLLLTVNLLCHIRGGHSSKALLKAPSPFKQLQILLVHYKLTFIQLILLSLCAGLSSSMRTDELYGGDKLLMSLHSTRGLILGLPLVAFMGDPLFKKFGSSSLLSSSLLAFGLEYISLGTLGPLPIAVIYFLLSPVSHGLGSFVVLKFAQGQEICLLPLSLFSCMGLFFVGKALASVVQGVLWEIVLGSTLLLVFAVIHLIKCKSRRGKLVPSSDPSEHI